MTHWIKPPAQCSVSLIDRVVNERQGGSNAKFFSENGTAWKAAVANYMEWKGNPEVVTAWEIASSNKAKFTNLYSSSADAYCHVPIIKSIRSRELKFCPACGEYGTPNTLDHYLPKDLFPEFAITPANLTPMCDICQGLKLARTLDDQQRRLFLHPYFDEFLRSHVVKLHIDPPYPGATMRLEADPDLPARDRHVLERHIKELTIEARYFGFFEKEFVRLLRLSVTVRAKGLSIPDQLDIWTELALLRAPNGWEHIFFASAQHNAELIRYLSEGELPAHL